MKAILITEDNQRILAMRWNVDELDYDDVLPIGYWLIADFGNNSIEDFPFETLTQEVFTATFGLGPFDSLEGDWIEVG